MYPIIIYTIIGIIGNAIIYIASSTSSEETCISAAIFFTIALLCQFMPRIFNSEYREKSHKNGLHLLCSFFLIAEIAIAALCIGNDVTTSKSIIWQLVTLGLFLIAFFSLANANFRTNTSIELNKKSKSLPLMEADGLLRVALGQNNNKEERMTLLELNAELQSMSFDNYQQFSQLDMEILSKVSELCKNPKKELKHDISLLIIKRKTMSMLYQQQ